MEYVLNFKALRVVPANHGVGIVRHLLLTNGFHQRGVFSQHALHIRIALQRLHEVVHLLTTCHKLLGIHLTPIGRSGVGILAPGVVFIGATTTAVATT